MRLKKSLGEGIKNIIFDLGGVIIDIDPMLSVNAFAELSGQDIGLENIFPEEDNFFLDYELGNISSDGFVEAIQKTCGCREIKYEDVRYAWCALIGGIDMRRFETLDKLKGNYRTFVLSNTNAFHIERVHEIFPTVETGREFESYFEKCFYSQDMHMHKPDREIYEAVIAATGINPAETLFIDDRAVNFSGATEAGLRTYHLTGGETILDIFG